MSILKQIQKGVEISNNKAAVISSTSVLTYAQLDRESNKLAHYLKAHNIGRGSIVPIIAERSSALIISILGVLKSGAAYLPVPTDWPNQRLVNLFQIANVELYIRLIETGQAQLPAGIRCLDISSQATEIANYSDEALQYNCLDSDLAYVIFTSGSTGIPKGVKISHRALDNRTQDFIEMFALQATDRCSLSSAIGFDAAVMEIFMTLAAGATLVIPDEEVKFSSVLFLEWMDKKNISVVFLTTPLMELLLPHWQQSTPVNSLRLLLTGGAQLRQRPPQFLPCQLINCYGPSEATVVATAGVVDPEEGQNKLPHIGKPLNRSLIYILDSNLQKVAQGEIGELYVGGEGLSSGYLGMAINETSQFMIDPFSDRDYAMMYATGDQCRVDSCGNIEFVGRSDDQVKIRGIRVELAEIEAQIIAIPEIKQAVVNTYTAANQLSLIGYIVLHQSDDFDIATLVERLNKVLPGYMVPEQWFTLSELPLTGNNKVDKNKLPLPELTEDVDLSLETLSKTGQKIKQHFVNCLAIEKLTYESNFIRLGGNSISAIVLLDSLYREFDVKVPLKTFLELPNIRGVEQYIQSNQQQNSVCVKKGNQHDGQRISLSPHQEIVWFQHQMAGESKAYHFKSSMKLTGRVNIAAFEQSLTALVARHEIFRTTIILHNEIPMQLIHSPYNIHLPVIDLSHLPEDIAEQQAMELLDGEFNRLFDLGELALVRWQMVKISDDYHVLQHVEHHLVHDGWSFNVFLGELMEEYRSAVNNECSSLGINGQYADYTKVLNEWLTSEKAGRQLNYWTNRLSDSPARLELPRKKDADLNSQKGRSKRITFSRKLWQQCEKVSQQHNVTPFIFALSILNLVLGRYANQNDVSIGSWLANRNWPGTDDIIGMLVNSVVLRNQIDINDSFQDYLEQVKQTALEAYDNQELPFAEIVKSLRPERVVGHNPLFQVILGFHDSPVADLKLPDVEVELIEGLTSGDAKFDLSLVVIPRKGQSGNDDPVHLVWEYRSDLYEHSLFENIIDSFTRVFEAALQPITRLSELPVIATSERNRQLFEFNSVSPDQPADHSVVELFERQVIRSPNKAALVCDGQRLTYAQLNQRANQLAHYLLSSGIKEQTLVGLCMERSVEMVIGLLGILKSGATYVPIEPSLPKVRVNTMLSDSEIHWVITQNQFKEFLGVPNLRLLLMDETSVRENLQHACIDNPCHQQRKLTLEQLAYVIYTSGSTGKPKGVCIEHSALQNLLLSMQKQPGISSDDRFLALTSIGFDIAALELFLPLISGAELHLASDELTKDMAKLSQYIKTANIDLMQATPATWQMLLYQDQWQPGNEFKALCGGEAMSQQLADQLLTRCGQLWNLYGPTETTIWSSRAKITGQVTVGKAIEYTHFYILNDQQQLLPIGTPGELYISGKGLARGYLRRAELTHERFIANPYATTNHKKLYRTGDLARWQPDGSIEIMGRLDNQIKLRGYRIELGEIEQTILCHESVNACVVLLREDRIDDKQIVAYIKSTSDEGDHNELNLWLEQTLPSYMLPSAIVNIAEFPLTANGKIDRQSLPAPTLEKSEIGFVKPSNPIEEQLIDFFLEILELNAMSVNESFFEKGGHSLLATKLIARIFKKFGIVISVHELMDMDMDTPARIASLIAIKQSFVESDFDDCEDEEVIF